MDTRDYRKEMREAILAIREENQDVIDSMPTAPISAAQVALAKKHGTPREFAIACNNAIGEISCLEAHSAIQRYRKKWDTAR